MCRRLPAAWRPAARADDRSATSTSATTTSRPRTTTPSGASTTAPTGQRQVLGKLRKALGDEPGRASSARSRSAPAPATSSLNLLRAGVVDARPWPPTSRPGMLDALSATAERLGARASRPRPARPAALPFEDESFDLVFGHAVLHHLPDLDARVPRVPARAAPRRRGRLLRRALALRRPARRSCPSAARRAVAPLWRRADGRAAPRAQRHTARPARRTRSSGWWTCTPSRPADARRATRAAPASSDVRVRGEELAASLVRLGQPRARGHRRARRDPVALAPVRLPRLPRCCRRSTARCSSRACRRRSSTTC